MHSPRHWRTFRWFHKPACKCRHSRGFAGSRFYPVPRIPQSVKSRSPNLCRQASTNCECHLAQLWRRRKCFVKCPLSLDRFEMAMSHLAPLECLCNSASCRRELWHLSAPSRRPAVCSHWWSDWKWPRPPPFESGIRPARWNGKSDCLRFLFSLIIQKLSRSNRKDKKKS